MSGEQGPCLVGTGLAVASEHVNSSIGQWLPPSSPHKPPSGFLRGGTSAAHGFLVITALTLAHESRDRHTPPALPRGGPFLHLGCPVSELGPGALGPSSRSCCCICRRSRQPLAPSLRLRWASSGAWGRFFGRDQGQSPLRGSPCAAREASDDDIIRAPLHNASRGRGCSLAQHLAPGMAPRPSMPHNAEGHLVTVMWSESVLDSSPGLATHQRHGLGGKKTKPLRASVSSSVQAG